MSERNFLFSEGDLSGTLENLKKKVRAEVAGVSQQQLSSATDEQLIDHFHSKFSIEPLTLYPDRAERSMTETMYETRDSFTYDIPRGSSIQVPGVAVTVKVPYTGDPVLFRLRPSMFSMNPPRGDVVQSDKSGVGHVVFSFAFNQHGLDPQGITADTNRAVNGTVTLAGNQKAQLEQFHRELRSTIGDALAQRRARLGGIQALAKALDIPVVQRPGMPTFTAIPVLKKVVKEPPPVADAKQAHGFSITQEAYANILRAIRAQGRTFEKAPNTFNRFDEEQLRDMLLANLNTHFQGGATGETFRAKGKTDICIEQENRAAFVGECKVWRGPKEVAEGLRQLLGYLTWRDCKTALVIFNKDRANFGEIFQKAPTVLREVRDLFISEQRVDEPGEWQMSFKALSDPGRVVVVRLMIYDIAEK